MNKNTMIRKEKLINKVMIYREYSAPGLERIIPLENYKNLVNNNFSNTISPKDKVYIVQKSLVPLTQFRKYYKNEIVEDIDLADIVIDDISRYLDDVIDNYSEDLYKTKSGDYTDCDNLAISNTDPEVFISLDYEYGFKNKNPTIIRSKIEQIQKYKFVDYRDIEFPGEIMDDTMYRKMRDLINSRDDEMRALAGRLIVNFSYEKNRDKMVMLFSRSSGFHTIFNNRVYKLLSFLENKARRDYIKQIECRNDDNDIEDDIEIISEDHLTVAVNMLNKGTEHTIAKEEFLEALYGIAKVRLKESFICDVK